MTDDPALFRRRFLEATGSTAALATLAGCSDSSDNATSGDGSQGSSDTGSVASRSGGTRDRGRIETDPSKTLRLVNSSITTFDPIAATDTASGIVVQQLFDGLMNYPDANTAVEPLLASDYQVSADYRTYTFSLKEGAQFHNGDPVRAQDFAYAFERLAGSKNSGQGYFILDSLGVKAETDAEGNYVPNSMAVEALDDTTLRIRLSEPFHATLEMLAYTAFAAVPEGLVGDIQGSQGEMKYTDFASKNPIGAGPFQLEDWQQDTEASVTRFENYHGGPASIAGVHWQVVSDPSAIYNYAMEKKVDSLFTPGLPLAQYDPEKLTVNWEDGPRAFGTYGPVRNGETMEYYHVTSLNTFYLGFDMANVPKPVRRAVAYVLNQRSIVEQVFEGTNDPAYHLTPSAIYPGGTGAYERHARTEYPYGYEESQPRRARQVMERAGYGPNDRFELRWTDYASSDSWTRVGRLLRDRLREAHIDMRVRSTDFSTLLEQGRSGQLEIYTLGWIADWPTPDNFLQLLNPPRTDTSRESPLSYLNWSTETGSAARKATAAYRTVIDDQAPTDRSQQARDRAYVRLEEANWEDVGLLPVYHAWEQRFSYDWVDIPPYGPMGSSRQKFDDVRIARNRGSTDSDGGSTDGNTDGSG
jgi:peptide/nickel transport system substrate-binding protein